jgi:hypothetical protein
MNMDFMCVRWAYDIALNNFESLLLRESIPQKAPHNTTIVMMELHITLHSLYVISFSNHRLFSLKPIFLHKIFWQFSGSMIIKLTVCIVYQNELWSCLHGHGRTKYGSTETNHTNTLFMVFSATYYLILHNWL